MASTLKLDTLTRAQITENADGSIQIVRTGIIKGIKTNGAANDEIFAESRGTAGMPAMLAPHPGTRYASALLQQIVIDAVPQNNNKTLVTLYYRTRGPASPVVTFVLSRRTTLVSEETEIHPNGTPMVVSWINPAHPLTDVVARTARNRYLRPYQRLVASGYWKNGSPPASMIAALGSVNDAPWRGLPKGYWLYADQSDVTQDKGNSYNITLELWSKLNEDWSTWDILRHQNGRNLYIDPAQVAAAKELGYVYGINDDYNGFLKTGLYPVADFSGIFGFGGIGA